MAATVAELLAHCPGVINVHSGDPFVFRSGLTSPVYVDVRVLPGHPRVFQAVVEALKSALSPIGDYGVAGVELGGVSFAAALGYATTRPSLVVRKAAKEHGTKRGVEGAYHQGMPVWVVEDTITTGGSALRAIEALQAAVVNVIGCACIFCHHPKRASGCMGEVGIPFFALAEPAEVSLHLTRGGVYAQDSAAKNAVLTWARDSE